MVPLDSCQQRWSKQSVKRAELLEVVCPTGDVTGESFAADVVQAAVQRFGRLDILVNNAGEIAQLCAQQLEGARRHSGRNTQVA